MKTKKKTVMITGGAGFIGSNFIRYFLSRYGDRYNIINFDKLTYAGNLSSVRDIKSGNYTFVRGDIARKREAEPVINRSDYVINFAAESHVDRSIKSSKEFIRTNVEGVENMLCLARKKGIEKFLQISTDEVYGSIKKGSFTEKSNLDPSSPYSASKASGDLLALAYYKTFGFPVLLTRSSNNYGPYQYPEKVIPLFITNAFRGLHLPLYSKGENVRNWIYVLDNCRGIDLVFHKGAPGEVYNIAGQDEVTNLELAKRLVLLTGREESFIRAVTDRPGHDFRYSIDSSKSLRLGFRQQFNLKEGLKKTVDWYKNNAWWWVALLK